LSMNETEASWSPCSSLILTGGSAHSRNEPTGLRCGAAPSPLDHSARASHGSRAVHHGRPACDSGRLVEPSLWDRELRCAIHRGRFLRKRTYRRPLGSAPLLHDSRRSVDRAGPAASCTPGAARRTRPVRNPSN